MRRRWVGPVAERGAVALEFALVLPLLIVLLLGVTTTGVVYSDHLAITNAVREGARTGAALDYNGNPAAWAGSVRTRVQQVYFNGSSTLSDAQVCVVLRSSTGTALAAPAAQGSCGTEPAAPSSLVAGSCVVKVWVQKPATIQLGLATIGPFTIGARSVSTYGRTSGSCTAS